MQSMFKLLVKASAIPVEKAKNWWDSSADIGILSFWNARCKPEPQTRGCVGYKAKWDHKCAGYDAGECTGKKKCYLPDDIKSEYGFCLGHKFKDDKDCLDYRNKVGCEIDSDCFFTADSHYESGGQCLGHKYSDDKLCSKYRTDTACNFKSDCFFQVDDDDESRENEEDSKACMAKEGTKETKSDKKGKKSKKKEKSKKCPDYRKRKCLKENVDCVWQ